MSSDFQILVINPGATSTKLAWYSQSKQIFQKKFVHADKDLQTFSCVSEQLPYRKEIIQNALEESGRELSSLNAIAARGGLLPPLAGGTYRVNEEMCDYLRAAVRGEHASNLGVLIGWDLAREAGCPVFVTDPVSVDELSDEARLSGFPPVPRVSLFHALNIRAVARRHCALQGERLEERDLVVCHLGTGISMAALKKGRSVDMINPRDEGPFGMDRSGGLPVHSLLKYVEAESVSMSKMRRVLFSRGGVFSYLGTRDLRIVEKMMNEGDEQAGLVFRAMAYQISKFVAGMMIPLGGKADAIIFTGGMARSVAFLDSLKQQVGFLGDVFVYPGEYEIEALALGALRVLTGEERSMEFHV